MASKINHWTPTRLARQDGRAFVITGANSGIGFEAAKILANHGGRVILLCRNAVKAKAAVSDIASSVTGSGTVEAVQMDLSDMASIRAGAEEIATLAPKIDALVANAGVMAPPRRQVTRDDFEMQFGTNHLGHFLLCGLLLPNISAAEGRVVAVSSTMHKAGLKRIRFEDPHWQSGYNPGHAYSQSKLANALFVRELNNRMKSAGKSGCGYLCHPGYASTALQTKDTLGLVKGVMAFGNAVMAQSAERGSWPTVLAAAETEAVAGHYYGPTGLFELRGPVGTCKLASQARDDEAAAKLWSLSEDAVDHRWDISGEV